MNEKIIQDISLTKLRASNTNPRKHFDEAYIAELGESIRQKGIIQPLTVRPDWCIGQSDEQIAALNGDSERKDAEFFEIVAGECRFRGAARASLADVPAIVRHLSDKETLEIQIIENLQRSDLTPLEEAEGYRRLIDEYGYTVQDVHVKTGKDKKTIYGKLKILKAPKILLDALIKKIVTEGHCELVGRIPSPDMREAAAREILQPKFLHENRYGGLERVSDQPMGLHVARAFVRDNFMRSLAGAQFDQNDASLVVPIIDDETGERIGGGACDDCPMRSGNRPDLTGELKRPDMCTNPKCFAAKTDAFFVRLQETAKKEGKRLLSDDECAEIFEEDGSLSGFTQYVKLSEQPPRVHVRDDVKKIPSWKKLMEECGEGKPEILIGRDPKGRIVELVDFNLAREAANIAAKSKGETSIFEQERKPSAHQRESAAATAEFGGEEPEWKKQERKNREIAKLNFQVTLAGLGELLNGIAGKGALNGLWDAVIEIAIGHAGHDGCWLMCKLLDLDPKMAGRGANGGDGPSGAVSQYARGLTGDNKKIGFLTTLLLSKDAKIYNSGSFGGLRNLEGFKPFAKLYKIDINEIEKRLKSVAREKTKAKKKSASRTGSSSRTGDGSPDVQTSSKKAKNATPPEIGRAHV